MRKLALIFFCFFAIQLFSQTVSIRTNDALNQLTNKATKSAFLNDARLKGSPYFEATFQKANIQYFDLNIIGETYLRYNGFTDEIEIGKNLNQKISDEIILKNNKIICSLGGETYYYLPFKNKENKIKLGYLTSIYKGNKNHLYERKRKIYREATIPRTSLERAFPPRFIDEKSYYLSIENETPFYLGKDVKKILKNLPLKLIKTAKEKSISMKGITDIKSLQHFFSQIE